MPERNAFGGNSAALRRELSARSRELATSRSLLHELTDGEVPSVIFGKDSDGGHGNFHPASYRRIWARPQWRRRLMKVHSASRRAFPRSAWRWMELDSANSSDALLMNIFCHPRALAAGSLRSILNVDTDAEPVFAYKPRIPLDGAKTDNTEIDMKLGALLVEAKLTESGFPSAKRSLVERYRDLETVFDVKELPTAEGRFRGYQLIRGTLAAYTGEASFCLLCDERRPDLIEVWYSIARAVRSSNLRCRLKLLSWQELAAALPQSLQRFLAAKYGIAAR